MARANVIDKKFANIPIILCLSCQLGKMHKIKANKSHKIIVSNITKPGDLIHIDQAAESSAPERSMTISGRNNKEKNNTYSHYLLIAFQRKIKATT
mmetsp:Transcript_24677/g.30348  ORF Transcript_24677/g.30348 Transcript_24677/m.30348 type:complete len:96 (+) Transcript_24677:405-692(+)